MSTHESTSPQHIIEPPPPLEYPSEREQSETRPEIFGTDVSSAIAQECTRTRGNLRTQLPTPDDTYE
ncbi:hypothetical protein PC118_g16807 [Phytophthora cactorum]|uniref:Uncharacterized protein n=1 Tax=Phytophthora cactorum TaxID=29920 RepID=A0A8T1BE49_9STRA|nr:hypothetical protein PC112_g16946 [Phytophthora cactorum]KAG2850184.1 hypothetical protein PC113_g17012 [Phytophthora cactorum]KAG2887637.1 hypothetical protein PC114_g18749 [Phytophthora cactorum]KAG2900006.1 hypothetical protein PC115_g16382 [Phytophthora cactorum]KAG2915484.1 hypothetical protein PC117_g17994 [Phytophthora cactorum]